MLRRSVAGTLAIAALALCAAACSSSDGATISASDKTFAGLDSAVVKEVVASPVAKERVDGDSSNVAAARYQGMVRNFIACRSALKAYQDWISSGTPPALAAQPEPTNPAPTAADMDKDIAVFQSDLKSGDITLLRTDLTNPTGCGNWIPAKPGDTSGPTIADVVNGTS